MGNVQARVNYRVEALSPTGQTIVYDSGETRLSSQNADRAASCIEQLARARTDDIRNMPVHTAGPRSDSFHLRLDRNHRVDKENGCHRLTIRHSGKDTGSGRVLLENNLDLTLTGFYADTADRLTAMEITQAEQLTNYLVSLLTHFVEDRLLFSEGHPGRGG